MQYKVPLVQNAMVSGYLAFIHLGGEVVVLLLLLNLQPNNFSAYLLRSSKSSNSSDRIAQLASKGAGVARSEDEDLEDEAPVVCWCGGRCHKLSKDVAVVWHMDYWPTMHKEEDIVND